MGVRRQREERIFIFVRSTTARISFTMNNKKKLRTRISSFYLLGRIHFKDNIEGRLKIIVDCFLFLMSVIILYSTSNTRSAISNLYLYRWLRKAKTINYAFVIAISNELTHSNWPFCISYCLMELFYQNVSSEGKQIV